MTQPHPFQVLHLPLLLFKGAVNLYLRHYRERHATEMEKTFRDCCRFAYSKRGMVGIYVLRAASMFGIVQAAAKEHQEGGVSAAGRTRLPLASLLAMALGLLGSLAPYGAIRGVLAAVSPLAEPTTRRFPIGKTIQFHPNPSKSATNSLTPAHLVLL